MADTVLILSYYFPPMNGPATQHPLWFFRFLPEYGLQAKVVCGSVFAGVSLDPHSGFEDQAVFRVPEGSSGKRLSRLLAELELRVQLRMGVWEHGFVWSSLAIRKASRLIRKHKVCAIISTSPTLASHWVAFCLKRRFPELIWIADFTDPLVGNPFRRTKSAFRGWEVRLEEAFFSEADVLSANTNTVRDMWIARYPQYEGKIVVTWNGFDPKEPVAARPIPGDRSAPLLSHVGAIYGGRLSNPFLESLHRLWQSGRLRSGELTVEFFGSNDFSAVRDPAGFAKLQELGIVRTKNTYVPRAEALKVSEEANFSFVLDVTEPHNTKLQCPSKLFDYIRIGRPVLAITPAGSPTEHILTNSGVEHVVIDTQAPPEAYDAGILKLLQLPPEPRQPSAWFTETFAAPNLAGGLARLIHGRLATRP